MVRKAVMDDFPVILNIYATARAFMAKTGNPTQWADGHPSADLLRECILAQKLFVFTDPDDFSQICGCFLFDYFFIALHRSVQKQNKIVLLKKQPPG